MNRVRAVVLIIMILFIVNILTVHSLSIGFQTEPLDKETQALVWSNLDIHKTFVYPTNNPALECFAVSESGRYIAMGFDDNRIAVCDADGKFLYLISFTTSGSYALHYDEEQLNISLVRSSITVLIDNDCKLVDMRDIDEQNYDNNKYWNDLSQPIKSVNGVQYEMKNNLGLLSIVTSNYSLLTKTDASGNNTTLYDSSYTYNVRFFACGAAILLFVIFVLIKIVRLVIKQQSEYNKK